MSTGYRSAEDKDKHSLGMICQGSNSSSTTLTELYGTLKQMDIAECDKVVDKKADSIEPISDYVQNCTYKEKLEVAKDEWTTGRLIDELFLELDNIKVRDEKNGLTKRKYEERTKWLIHRIPVYRPAPPFIVNLSDLSTRIRQELADLENETLDHVLKETIGRIFEGVDQRYFRLSVRRFLKWEICK